MGGGLWDALHGEGDVEAYKEGITRVHETVLAGGPSGGGVAPATMWVGMTTVVNDRLATDDKRFWLTEPKLAAYREVVESSGVFHDMDGVIDGVKLTSGQRQECYDGVHYSDLTYDAFAQVAANLIAHLELTGTIGAGNTPSTNKKPSVEKDVSGMGSTTLGLLVLFLASVMVVTRDAFHGVMRLALTAFGGPEFDPDNMSWEATYGDLLRKIGRHPDGGSELPAAAIGGAKGGVGIGGGGGNGGNGGSRLRERGRSANRGEDEEETRTLLADGDEGRVTARRGILEMSAVSSARSAY